MSSQSSGKFQIKSPCAQDWTAMTPAGQGRFCGACDKTVVDFTNTPDEQIISAIRESSQHVCGRLKLSQLTHAPAADRQFNNRLYHLLFGLLLITSSANASGETGIVPGGSILNADCAVLEEHALSDTGKTVVGGYLIGAKTKEPLQDVLVIFRDNQTIRALTNREGKFVLNIPNTLLRKRMVFLIRSIGVQPDEIVIAGKQLSVFRKHMVKDEEEIEMGEVVVVPAQ